MKIERPSQVILTSKEGEVKMTIDMNITLNINAGTVAVSTDAKVSSTEKLPDFEYQIPDFGSDERIDFGKKV